MTSKVPCSMKDYSLSCFYRGWLLSTFMPFKILTVIIATLRGDISKDKDAMQFRKILEWVHFSMIYF